MGPDLIALRGAPGVGKSTAAAGLAARFPRALAIEVDDLCHGFHETPVPSAGPSEACHLLTLVTVATLAPQLVRTGAGPIVVVDPFYAEAFEVFSRALRGSGITWSSASLVVEPGEHERRLRARRAADPLAPFDLAMSLRLNRELLEENDTVIDTTHLASSEVVSTLAAMRVGRTRAHGSSIHERSTR